MIRIPGASWARVAAGLSAGASQTAGMTAPWDRTVLPIPPAPYTNRIGMSYRDSQPQIHPLVAAPPGAPNIFLILIDDAGYGQTGTFGAPIPTPTLDRLAAGGLRYTRFHVAAICSASRAALLTGRNHHSVGMGIGDTLATAYPGYDSDIPKSAALVSEILRQNGYSTAAFGKWHLAPAWETSPVGPFDHWPTSEGFDYYYGFLGGDCDQWNPELYEERRPTAMQIPPGRKGDYTLNESLADKAIAWIEREKSIAPGRPFFVYYAPGATHAPLQAPKAWIDKFKGGFDMGWDRYREIVFERQKRLGVIPADTELTPRPPEFPAWDSLSSDEKKVAARFMEVFAGYMAQTDHEIGRIVDAIAAAGQLDNTLIFFIAGDNGADLGGHICGAFNQMALGNGVQEETGYLLRHLDEFGLASSSPQYAQAWAWAGNTPFQWGKTIASHLGGTRDPLVVYWPARIRGAGGVRSQFHHLIDVAPTLLEAAGLPEPVRVNGVRQKPIEGISMAYTFDQAAAPGRRATQYFEMMANRSIYDHGWIAAARSGRVPGRPLGDYDFEAQPWELYEISGDYSERRNLAAVHPEKLREMKELFLEEARRHQVFPLDPRYEERRPPGQRPSLTPDRAVYVYYASSPHVGEDMAPPVRNRSYSISAEIVEPKDGGDGVIVAEGGRFCGYSLFVKNGRVRYTYNFIGRELTTLASSERLPPGPATIGLRFDYDGGGPGGGGVAGLFISGRKVAEKRIPRTAALTLSWHEAFDIGEDTGTPVGDYASPFAFQGRIRTVTFDLAPRRLAPAAQAWLLEGQRVVDNLKD